MSPTFPLGPQPCKVALPPPGAGGRSFVLRGVDRRGPCDVQSDTHAVRARTTTYVVTCRKGGCLIGGSPGVAS